MLAAHGGNVELVQVEPPDTVKVRFLGACDGCAASQLTFVAGVKKPSRTPAPRSSAFSKSGLAAAPAGAGAGVRFISPFAGEANGAGAGEGLVALGGANAWQPASELEEIPLGGILRRDIGGRDLLLSCTGESITCFANACAHLGLPLDGGEIAAGVITCPHHGFQYLLATGECLTAPAVQLEQHAVRLLDNRVEIRLGR